MRGISLCAGLTINMADGAGRIDHAAGLSLSMTKHSASSSESAILQVSLLPQDSRQKCVAEMCLQRAYGPHPNPSGPPPVANRPTIEEIIDLQSAIAAAIGVKGSELRQKANKLAKLGICTL